MCAEWRNIKWILMLLLLGGGLCSTWNVDYQQEHICAVKGSSVAIFCSFTYPVGEEVQYVMWTHEKHNIYNGPFIYQSEADNNTSSKFHYIGDKNHNCSFIIHQVEHSDSRKYTFRFITTSSIGKWTGKNGPLLHIVDLNISMTKPNGKETIKEGDSVNLTCINSCDGGNKSSAFTWFKNGEPINEGPVLYLRNISLKNSGNYTCSLKAHTGTTSGVTSIDIEYGPKNTSVSILPSSEVAGGSKVTLICSSHANPAVKKYTWFKIYSNNITVIGHKPEQHFREFLPSDEGQYLCVAANNHGSHNSSIVTLKIKDLKGTEMVIIFVLVAALLALTAVVVIRRFNKKKAVSPDSDSDGDKQNTDYVNWLVVDTIQPQEENQCEGGLIYATIDFNTSMKSDMAQVDVHNDEDCVIYSTVYRNQQLNPTEFHRHQMSL